MARILPATFPIRVVRIACDPPTEPLRVVIGDDAEPSKPAREFDLPIVVGAKPLTAAPPAFPASDRPERREFVIPPPDKPMTLIIIRTRRRSADDAANVDEPTIVAAKPEQGLSTGAVAIATAYRIPPGTALATPRVRHYTQ